jgi:hypothetical protein
MTTAYDQWRTQSRDDGEEELTEREIQRRLREEARIDAAESCDDYGDERNSRWGWN